jgi:putative transposase
VAEKKVRTEPVTVRWGWIEPDHPVVSLAAQCELLGLSRSHWYDRATEPNPLTLELMRRLDEEYTAHPFYGSRRMTAVLRRAGYAVNRKRVLRLMRQMGLAAIYPKPALSRPDPDRCIYPYLLRGVTVTGPDHVWSTDITYLRLSRGFGYLAAILDWYSRKVLAWRLSNTLETRFCLDCLDEALRVHQPLIFNSDQGVQFTSAAFTDRLAQAGIRISMDGRGRAHDNIFVERLWRSVKYEEVYPNGYDTLDDAHHGLYRYFDFYNHQRPHQALGYRTPAEVYADRAVILSPRDAEELP